MHTGTFRKLSVLWVLLTVGVILQAYTVQSRAQESPQEITLILGDYRFTPASVEVEAGRPVILTVTNKDGIIPHNFTLQDADAGMDIDRNVGAGSTVRIEFIPETAGSFPFHCNKKLPFMKSHRARGMEGLLVVNTPTLE